jgi:hypothetical protein
MRCDRISLAPPTHSRGRRLPFAAILAAAVAAPHERSRVIAHSVRDVLW